MSTGVPDPPAPAPPGAAAAGAAAPTVLPAGVPGGVRAEGAFAAFGVPAFRHLWGNTVLFALVQSTQRFTYVWLVLELGHGSAASGVVLFALGVPVLVVSMPAGALADRIDRRLLMIASQVGALAVTVATAVLVATDRIGVPAAVLLAALLGVSLAVGQPVRTAVVPSLVGRELLLRAVVMMTLGMNVSMIVGPAIGGGAIALWGLAGAFTVQAVLYAVGLLFLLPLRIPPLPAPDAPSRMLAQIREGLAFVASRRDIRGLFTLVAGTGVFMLGPYMALIPEVARDELGADAFGTSMLFAVLGVGMLIGSMYLARRGEVRAKGALLGSSLAVGGIVLALMGLSPWYALSAALMLVWGVGGGLFVNLNQTLIQSHTPHDVMGRVMSLHSLAMQGLGPAGALLAGALAAGVGAPAAIALCGVGMTAVAVSVLVREPLLRDMT